MTTDSSQLKIHMSELSALVALCSHDITSLSGGCKRASTDCRKRLSVIAKLTSELRSECLQAQKAIPKRIRKSTEAKAPQSFNHQKHNALIVPMMIFHLSLY